MPMNEKHLAIETSETSEVVEEDQPELKYWPEIRDSFFLSQGDPGFHWAILNVYAHLCPEKFQHIREEWFDESEPGMERADRRLIKGLGAYVNHKQVTLSPEIIREKATNWLMEGLYVGNAPAFPVEDEEILRIARCMGRQDWKHLQAGRYRPNPSSGYSLRNSPDNSQLFHFAFIAKPEDHKLDSMLQVGVVSAATWRHALENGTLKVRGSVARKDLWGAYNSFMLHLTNYPEHQQYIPDDFLHKMRELLKGDK